MGSAFAQYMGKVNINTDLDIVLAETKNLLAEIKVVVAPYDND